MTDTPEGTGTEAFASISDAAAAYANVNEDENPVTDTLDNQEQEAPASDEDTEVTDAPSDDDDDLDDDFSEDEGQAQDEDPDGPDSKSSGYVADDAKVKLEDGTETTVAELRKGSLRQADYTRKAMAIADKEKAIETEAQQVKSLQAQLQQQSDLINKVASQFMPKPPDPALADPNSDRYDPLSYQAMRVAYDNQIGELQRFFAGDNALKAKSQQEQEHKAKQKRTDEWNALAERVPAFRDPKTAQPSDTFKKFWSDAVKIGAEYGLKPEEMQGITDHRYYLFMRDAVAYRRAKAKKADARAKGEGKPPVIAGSKRRDAGDHRARDSNAAMDRLKQTGSLRDGVAALLALEKG